jgi:hypothetical protein
MTGNTMGWMLVWVGLVVTALGFLWLFVPWFGRLPGDIRIEGVRGGIYIPITTCILLSVLLSLALWVARFLSR